MTGFIKKALNGFERIAGDTLPPFADLAMRLIMARMFLKSGMLKIKDFEGTIDMFQTEYFGEISYSLASLIAGMATVGETLLPVLLVVGLLTRFAATGLFVMTMVISILVYPFWTESGMTFWWNDHAWWAVILLAIMAYGPQKFSLDAWLKSRK